VILVDLIESRVAADRTGLLIAQAMSSEPIEVPDPTQARADFDAALTVMPERVDRQMLDLRKGLGG